MTIATSAAAKKDALTCVKNDAGFDFVLNGVRYATVNARCHPAEWFSLNISGCKAAMSTGLAYIVGVVGTPHRKAHINELTAGDYTLITFENGQEKSRSTDFFDGGEVALNIDGDAFVLCRTSR